eukprot:TRINITY_DN25194_c0_g1_i1.p1 TRINITY_DN25194_c0_g1~~TRINITY_DN25194_c0_g1_i1.p1  ORF type:complete len:345 (+),score=66.30 TRINITY_DN25194_c0_g1_i1:182-1216(+)
MQKDPAERPAWVHPELAHVRGVGLCHRGGAHGTKASPSAAREAGPLDSFLRLLAAGAGAGAITKVLVAPLERAKFLMQMAGMGRAPQGYSSLSGTIRDVVNRDGPLALYRGCFTNVLRTFPAYALQFSLTDTFRAGVADRGQPLHQLRVSQMICASTAAGALQTFVTHPLEQLRLRLYIGAELHERSGATACSLRSCARDTLRIEGIRGFYRGAVSGIVTGAPFVGCQMTAHDFLWLRSPGPQLAQDQAGDRAFWQFVCGAAAGVGTQTVLYPLDTLWRRMMADGAWGRPPRYGSSWKCIQVVYREEGVRGAWAGAGANALRAIPAAGIQFVAYDALKRLFTPP